MLAGEWTHRLLDPELYEQSRKAQDRRPGAMESKCVLLMDKAVGKGSTLQASDAVALWVQ